MRVKLKPGFEFVNEIQWMTGNVFVNLENSSEVEGTGFLQHSPSYIKDFLKAFKIQETPLILV